MKPWELSEDGIEKALRRCCDICGAAPGQECITPTGELLINSARSIPVHDDRTR